MKAALIGLGMVSKTYADAFANSKSVTLGPVFARSSTARDAFVKEHPDLGARAAISID